MEPSSSSARRNVSLNFSTTPPPGAAHGSQWSIGASPGPVGSKAEVARRRPQSGGGGGGRKGQQEGIDAVGESSKACAMDLGRLLTESDEVCGLFSDVTFSVAEDGRKFRAHRAVLCARSEVFARQFRAGMKESSAGPVEITVTDCSSAAFSALLGFLYSGVVSGLLGQSAQGLPMTVVVELLELGDRYLLATLKGFCETALLSAVLPETACDLLVVAERFGCQNLRAETLGYIVDNWSKISTEFSERLDVLSKPLFIEIVSEFNQRRSRCFR